MFFGGFLLILIFVLSWLFVWTRSRDDKDKTDTQTPPAQGENVKTEEARPARTQAEIIPEYNRNMKQLLETIQAMEGTKEEIFSRAEAGFFNIYVPNDLKDLHIQTLLEIQKLADKPKESADAGVVKERLSSLLNNLLEKNESLN